MLHWGFIGCGDVVKKKSGAAFWIDGKSDVTAVMSRNIEHCSEYAKNNNIPDVYTDAQELINSSNVNAIYVATPPSSHMEYTKIAILAGKSVYVEKPLALTYSECEEISELSEKHNVPVYTAFYRRALPYFSKLKAVINSGIIGNIRQVIIRQSKKYNDNLINNWRLKPEISGGGLLNDTGCHAIDIIMFLLGEFTEYSGFSINHRKSAPVDDSISLSFRIGDILGIGIWCYDGIENYDKTEIIGDNGKIIFSLTQLESFSVIKGDKEEKFSFESEPLVQKHMIQNVVDSILGATEPLSTEKNACFVSKIIDNLTSVV